MKIIIADDHTIVREGVRKLLEEAFLLAEIEEANDTVSLVKKVRAGNYDVIITDITMPPGDSGLDAVKTIKSEFPSIPVLIMSMHAAEHYAVRALKAGAAGYLSKDAASLELVHAINTVLQGKRYINDEVAIILADVVEIDHTSHSHENLSDRELEVFKLLANGKTVTDIAKELSLSPNTISTFRSKLLDKMNFRNSLELIKYALDNKLI